MMNDPNKELRPAARARDPKGHYDSQHEVRVNNNFVAPAYDIPENTSDELKSFIDGIAGLSPIRDIELKDIKVHYEGDKKHALSSKYFPKPENVDTKIWQANRRLLTHVNLVQPAVRAWVNSVYSEDAYRSIEENPYKDILEDWIESDEYADAIYEWTSNQVAYGTAVFVPRFDTKTDEISCWLPHPVHTYIFVDPSNPNKLIAVAEITENSIQFIHLKGEGVLYRDGDSTIEARDFGWLPVAVKYGIDQTANGEVYGIPMVRDAYNGTIAATSVWFNIRMLQRQQTKSILMRVGNPEDMESYSQGADAGVLNVPEGGKADFISPQPKIKESISVLKQQIGLLSTASGISADILDPTITEASSSAEAARIRALPFIQNAKEFKRRCRSGERKSVLATTGMIQHYKTKKPINIVKLKKSVKTDIGLTNSTIPLHPNEETQDTIAKVVFGIMAPDDAVRKYNGTKTKDKIEKMAQVITERLAAEGAQAMFQKIVGGGRPTDKEQLEKKKEAALQPADSDEE